MVLFAMPEEELFMAYIIFLTASWELNGCGRVNLEPMFRKRKRLYLPII